MLQDKIEEWVDTPLVQLFKAGWVVVQASNCDHACMVNVSANYQQVITWPHSHPMRYW